MIDCGLDHGHDFGGDPLGLAFDMIGDVDVCGADILAECGHDVACIDFDGHSGLGILGMSAHGDAASDSLDLRTRGVHVVGHGYTDVKQLFAEHAEKSGLIRVPFIQVGGRDLDSSEERIVPVSRWSRKLPKGTMPAGAAGNSSGRTRWWRQYWQVGKKSYPWSKPSFDREALAFFEVVCISWEYGDTCDCETMLIIRVKCLSRYSSGSECWSHLRSPLQRHDSAGSRLRGLVKGALSLARPGEAAQLLRAHAMRQLQVA
ncbi:MAG: hypothetical protein AB7W16_12110 [Candidatus Obscuribacterales bacterium]